MHDTGSKPLSLFLFLSIFLFLSLSLLADCSQLTLYPKQTADTIRKSSLCKGSRNPGIVCVGMNQGPPAIAILLDS